MSDIIGGWGNGVLRVISFGREWLDLFVVEWDDVGDGEMR